MKRIVSDIEIYLYLSYLPKLSEVNLNWLNNDCTSRSSKNIESRSWWIKEGVKTLKQTMADEVASADPKADHILLLSGGLDSRAILGGLLENLPTSKIIAATYGIPGAWDYEYAKLLARKFGLRHEVFNLLSEKWDVDSLTKAATRLHTPISVHQSYIRQKINNYFGQDCIYWSGFLGDALGGYHLPKISNKDKRVAVKRQIETEPTLHYQDKDFEDSLVEKVLNEFPWERTQQENLSIDQILNFGLRQRYLLQPIVVVNGFNFKTPFLNRIWSNFMLNAPYTLLLEQYLYKSILRESYKSLANFPSESGAGMRFYASKPEMILGKIISKIKPYIARKDPYLSHPRTNYINWAESLRHKGSFQDTIFTTLQDLKKRAIFDNKDLDVWWQDHLTRKMDYTTLLMNLSSLELLLKAGVM